MRVAAIDRTGCDGVVQFRGPFVFQVQRNRVGQVGFIDFGAELGRTLHRDLVVFGDLQVVPETLDLVE